jgi:hypothetical protein
LATLRILVEDQPRLVQIAANVVASRAALSLPPLSGNDLYGAIVQVGLNSITNGRDVPYSRANIPTLTIHDMPYTEYIVTFSAELDARVTAIANVLGASITDLSGLALHAGCLVLLAETDNKGYVPHFGPQS